MDTQANGNLDGATGVLAAGLKDDKAGTFQIYLVNPTGVHYTRVVTFTGAFCGDEEGVLETSKFTKERGALAPHSALLLETSDNWELDFVIWYHIDLYTEGHPTTLERIWFSVPKYWSYRETIMKLPVLNLVGLRIEVLKRNWHGTIEQEVKQTHMGSQYIRTSTSE